LRIVIPYGFLIEMRQVVLRCCMVEMSERKGRHPNIVTHFIYMRNIETWWSFRRITKEPWRHSVFD